jgi:hypothetical protein
VAIALDQANIGTTGSDASSGTTITVTTTASVAANRFIVLAIGGFASAITVTAVSDNSGSPLTWTVDKQGHATNPASPLAAIASAQAPAGLASGTVITVTYSASSQARAISASTWSGVATSSPVDTTAGPVGVSPAATGYTTGNVTVAAGSVLIGNTMQETGAFTSTPTAPSIELRDWLSSGGSSQVANYRIETSAGTVANAGTFSTAGQSNTVAVAYKAAPAALQALTMAPMGR